MVDVLIEAYERKPNEVILPAKALADLLAAGRVQSYSVYDGPTNNREIVGARFEHGFVILEYDQPVSSPELRNTFGSRIFRGAEGIELAGAATPRD